MTTEIQAEEQEQKRRAKKLRDARLTTKLAPFVGVLSFGLLALTLYRYAAAPGMVTVLRAFGYVGGLILAASLWQQAQQTIRDSGRQSPSPYVLLGILITFACPNLADMYRNGHMDWFRTMAAATLVAVLLCVVLAALEHITRRRNSQPL